MTNDDDVLLPLQLHDDRFESDHDILVRFTSTVYGIRQCQDPAGEYLGLRTYIGSQTCSHHVQRSLRGIFPSGTINRERKVVQVTQDRQIYGNLLVCHSIADTGVEFIQRLPGLLGVWQVSGGSDSPLQKHGQ
jgi:hypothetical protein